MKRLLSICFAAILFFNLGGYRLLIEGLQHHQEQTVAKRIDVGIDEAELVSIKVPASLPYYTNSRDFQWVKGEVNIEGTLYQYVKRRIYNDSIEYLCLKDLGKTKLLNARDQFFQLAFDLQNNKRKSSTPTMQIKPLLLEYCEWDEAFSLAPILPIKLLVRSSIAFVLPETFFTLPGKPPEILG